MIKAKPSGRAKSQPEVKLVEDAWPRFERFIKGIAKACPKDQRTVEKAD